jgi:dolichyl-phosphate-mannose--protein O-mannosyl transferase
MPYHIDLLILYLLRIVITQFCDIAIVQRKDSLLPILVIAASAVSITATVVLAFYGIYFFFFFLPLAFGLPCSVKKLWRNKARQQWNVEDMR